MSSARYNVGARARARGYFISVLRTDWVSESVCAWCVGTIRGTWVPSVPLPSTLQYALRAQHNYQARLNADDVHESRQSGEARARQRRTARARTQKLPLVIIKDVKWIGIHICNCSLAFRFFPSPSSYFPFPFSSLFSSSSIHGFVWIGWFDDIVVTFFPYFFRSPISQFLPIHLAILINTSFE